MFDIIFVALARWDGPYSSTAFSIAKELSKTHRVFFVDNPITWKYFFVSMFGPVIKSRWRSLLFGKHDPIYPINSNLEIITPRLVLPINWMSNGKVYRFFLRVNNNIINKAISKAMAENKVKNYVFINSFNPFYWVNTIGKVPPRLTVYQSVDNITKSAYIAKHGPQLEKAYAERSDLVITTSSQLKEKLSECNDKVFLVPNAADISLFKKAFEEDLALPEELQGIKQKIIIYTGNICHRLNYDLLNKIAGEYDDKILVMVGPVAADSDALKELKGRNNVIFTGPKKLEELPAFLKYAHCAIIPFLCNELTASIYPLKINEYLASGIPVVTTNFSKDIMDFGEVTYLSDTSDVFVNNIGKALEEDSYEKKEQRVKKASGNTWESRTDQLLSLINQSIK